MAARLGPLTQGVIVADREPVRVPLKRIALLGGAVVVTLGSWLALEGSSLPVELSISPAGAEAPSEAPAPESRIATKATSSDPRCERALEVVAQAGLQLQVTTEFRCPGNTQTKPADRQHSGVACWNHTNYCPNGSYIAINPAHIRERDDRIQHVIAHEICHIQHYFAEGTPGSEADADACAAAAGFPR